MHGYSLNQGNLCFGLEAAQLLLSTVKMKRLTFRHTCAKVFIQLVCKSIMWQNMEKHGVKSPWFKAELIHGSDCSDEVVLGVLGSIFPFL